MKLTYRGIRYDAVFNELLTNAGVTAFGMYRGVGMLFRSAVSIPKPLDISLKWRGIAYCMGSPVKQDNITADQVMEESVGGDSANVMARSTEPSPNQPMATRTKMSVRDESRNLFVRHHQKTRQREQSMLIRLNEDVGLDIADVAHYETHIQGKIPHDFAGYDRSRTAMS
ncbi:MAG: DUF4278 domain-containing protein [Cyanobacteria bacterium J06627_8]